MDVAEAAAPPSSAASERERIDGLMVGKMQILSSARRGRKPALSTTSRDSLAKIKTTVVVSPHKANPAGVTCLALQQQTGSEGELILTGGMDRDAMLLARDGSLLAKLSGHGDKVTAVAFTPVSAQLLNAPVFTASADKTVKIWTSSGGSSYGLLHTFAKPHSDQVSAISVLPIGSCLLSFSLDGSWALLDVTSRSIIRHALSPNDKLLSGQCHPDGLLLGAGTDAGQVKIYDIREQKIVGNLEGHTAGVSSLCFSENGYSLAAGDGQGTLRLWDLRKMSTSLSLNRELFRHFDRLRRCA